MSIRIATDVWMKQNARWQQSTYYFLSGAPDYTGIKLALFSLVKLLRISPKYDVVITANVRTAVLFGLVRAIFKIKNPKHIVLELRLDEEQQTIFWKLKRYIQSIAFSSIESIFVSAKKEIKSYSLRLNLPEERFHFLPFHTNVVNPRKLTGTGGYIFSAGRTGRDYKTLLEAVRNEDYQVVIVSDNESIKNLDIPDNVSVYTNLSYEEYRSLLQNALIVVVPLYEHVYSSGQVVVLESMALGKPVITNKSVGVDDYIQNNLNGIILKNRNSTLFRNAIRELIDNPKKREQLVDCGMETILEKHTFERYVDTIINEARVLSNI